MSPVKKTEEEKPEPVQVTYKVTVSYDTLHAGDQVTLDPNDCAAIDAAAIKSGILQPVDG